MKGRFYGGGMMPAPSEKSLTLLQNNVVKGGYDMGIAMDGDGDRLGIIDKSGRYIDANEILCMLYWYLVKYNAREPAIIPRITTTETAVIMIFFLFFISVPPKTLNHFSIIIFI